MPTLESAGAPIRATVAVAAAFEQVARVSLRNPICDTAVLRLCYGCATTVRCGCQCVAGDLGLEFALPGPAAAI